MSLGAAALGLARQTVQSHHDPMEITNARTLRFDTGFVSFVRGWDPLRPEDLGLLWEHLVLEHLQAHSRDFPVRYWRDRNGREVDFTRDYDGLEVRVCTPTELPSP